MDCGTGAPRPPIGGMDTLAVAARALAVGALTNDTRNFRRIGAGCQEDLRHIQESGPSQNRKAGRHWPERSDQSSSFQDGLDLIL
jgi:hypothetical protein